MTITSEKKKVIVWGTGAVLKKKYKLLSGFNIVYFVDKDNNKQGLMLDNIEIKAPHELKHEECDYIILMTDYYKEIACSIECSNIPAGKVIPYIYIEDILEYIVTTQRGLMYLEEWSNCNNKKVLLITHEFSRTGAPMAVLNLAIELRGMGYSVLLAGLGKGMLIHEVADYKFDYIEDISYYYYSNRFLCVLKEFEFVVVNTMVLNNIVVAIARKGIKVLWWIHEVLENYYENSYIENYPNVYIYGVGGRVVEVFRKYYPEIKIESFLYSIPDFFEEENKSSKESKLVIALIGSIQPRKGVDILIDALRKLSKEKLSKMKLLIIGALQEPNYKYWKENEHRFPEGLEVDVLGELGYQQMECIYRQIDILVAPSRQDAMPMVVTEAMMNCVPCIVSGVVGQAEFMKQGKNGFVFENLNELVYLLNWSLDNRNKLKNVGKASRKIYLEHFVPNKMHMELVKIIDKLNGKGKGNE